MALAEPILFILIVLSGTWLISRTIDFTSARLSRRYEGEERAANAHEMLTRIKMGKHFLTVSVLIAGLAVALWQFEWFKAIGYGLLASAGVAALVLGVAAQRPLSNLFAGVQLALTQPVRVGDAVIFDGNWGWIEEISVTYVIIRTWDMRRLIVPTARIMDNSVENWTKGGSNMMKPVYLYADYRVDVPRPSATGSSRSSRTPTTGTRRSRRSSRSPTARRRRSNSAPSARPRTRPSPGTSTARSASGSSPSSATWTAAPTCPAPGSPWSPTAGRPGRRP